MDSRIAGVYKDAEVWVEHSLLLLPEEEQVKDGPHNLSLKYLACSWSIKILYKQDYHLFLKSASLSTVCVGTILFLCQYTKIWIQGLWVLFQSGSWDETANVSLWKMEMMGKPCKPVGQSSRVGNINSTPWGAEIFPHRWRLLVLGQAQNPLLGVHPICYTLWLMQEPQGWSIPWSSVTIDWPLWDMGLSSG